MGRLFLKPDSERKPKMVGEMRSTNLETLINRLEILPIEGINTSDEFARQMTETLHQMPHEKIFTFGA